MVILDKQTKFEKNLFSRLGMTAVSMVTVLTFHSNATINLINVDIATLITAWISMSHIHALGTIILVYTYRI